MKNSSYINANNCRKCLENKGKNQFLKIKNSTLELQKHFIELEDREERN